MIRIVRNILAIVILVVAMPQGVVSADEHFKTRVAPILQRRCLSCHRDTVRKGDLSLQTRSSLIDGGYVTPGDSTDSPLLQTITPLDGSAQMPKDSDALKPNEIDDIRKWIDEGAVWPAGLVLEQSEVSDFDWWSYKPISRPSVPSVSEASGWVRNPIDAFVLRKLIDQNLVRSGEADRRTLIRRLTFDLIGLPPAPEDVSAFVTSEDPQAYEKLVDQLLESKHYGERWARHWLDVVKYADTCGYDKDKLRPNAWPYRDYVIRSFNDDKPYARFIQEQIAGDVLFPGETDSIPGLGFIAAGPWDFIGHVEVPESKIDGQVARNLDRDDMVSNTLNTFCSVTVQCARCHNHKFDPITQDDYYGLQAIFAAVDRAERTYGLDPDTVKQQRQLTAEVNQFRSELKTIATQIAAFGGPRLAELTQQIEDLRKNATVKKTPEYGYHSTIVKNANSPKWVEVVLPELTDISRIVIHPCHDEFANIGAGFGFPVRFKVEVATDRDDEGGTDWTVVSDHTEADLPNPGLTEFAVNGVNRQVRRVRVSTTQLATRSGDYILALAELQVFDQADENVALKSIVRSRDSIQAPVRWDRKNLIDGLFPVEGDESGARQLAKVMRERTVILQQVKIADRIQRRQELEKLIQQKQDVMADLPKGKMVYAASTDFAPQGNFKPTKGKLRPVHLLHRGNIQQPGDLVVPCVLPLKNAVTNTEEGTTASLKDGRLDANLTEGERRAALATWLSGKDHPLVWRSIVNRVWQYHFGRGIVATSNDFGRMGTKPTHPELLDWLAATFRDGDQSLKQLHRLIVTSSAYRQSSRSHAGNSKIDGGNQFLWRMNRRRLEAEEIRDSILSVSGAMNAEMGGPGFYLFKLEKPQHSPHFEYHKFDPSDPNSHRRSIYRFIVRSQPDPWMTTLDCADSSQSTARRNETLTSLQALSLLNNRFNLTMAQTFAERLQQDVSTLPGQVDRAMLLVTQRLPKKSERQQLIRYAQNHGLPNLCRILFNLSEFVYLD